jgi:hypothetical protein
VCRAVHMGLQGLVITEHHHLWSSDALETLRRDAGVGDEFVLLGAQEVDTDIGHVLVFGADRTIGERTKLAELRRRFPDAALVWAHPFRNDRVPSDEALLNPLLDGVELFNSNHSPRGNYLALDAWHRLKFVATGGSDAHAVETAGRFPTQLDHPVASIAELAREIRHGRCRPFFKEIPRSGSNLTVTEITVGTKGDDEQRQRLVIKRYRTEHKWRQQQPALDVVAALQDRGFTGETFRVPRILEVNADARLLIEEGQRGRLLHQLLQAVSPEVADTYFELSALWLAAMHRLALRTSTPEAAARRERRRFRSYHRAFARSHSPHLELAGRMLDIIAERAEQMLTARRDQLVQSHGDYHPKNIIIGQDRGHDISTVFVSVIDFANTLQFLPAFDVGYFLAQLRYQLRDHPRVLERHTAERFVESYLSGLGDRPAGFDEDLPFFEARANMSIASFLIKVGKGESPDMTGLMARTRRLLGA